MLVRLDYIGCSVSVLVALLDENKSARSLQECGTYPTPDVDEGAIYGRAGKRWQLVPKFTKHCARCSNLLFHAKVSTLPGSIPKAGQGMLRQLPKMV